MPIRKINSKRVLSVLISPFFCAISMSAQTKVDKRILADEEPFVTNRNFGFSIIPIVAAKASFKGDTKKYSLQSAPQLSMEVLVDYHYEFKRIILLFLGSVVV